MELTKWEPLYEHSSLRRQMERFWESFFGREAKEYYEEGFIPYLDVAENENEILVKVDVPGIDEKDISVNLSGDNFIIKGERKEEKEEKEKHYHRVERSYGNFQRVVALPVSVSAEKINAEFENGVLEVHLPKKEEAKLKEIPIKISKN